MLRQPPRISKAVSVQGAVLSGLFVLFNFAVIFGLIQPFEIKQLSRKDFVHEANPSRLFVGALLENTVYRDIELIDPAQCTGRITASDIEFRFNKGAATAIVSPIDMLELVPLHHWLNFGSLRARVRDRLSLIFPEAIVRIQAIGTEDVTGAAWDKNFVKISVANLTRIKLMKVIEINESCTAAQKQLVPLSVTNDEIEINSQSLPDQTKSIALFEMAQRGIPILVFDSENFHKKFTESFQLLFVASSLGICFYAWRAGRPALFFLPSLFYSVYGFDLLILIIMICAIFSAWAINKKIKFIFAGKNYKNKNSLLLGCICFFLLFEFVPHFDRFFGILFVGILIFYLFDIKRGQI